MNLPATDMRSFIRSVLNEQFMHRSGDYLSNLIQSFKTLFLQFKYAVDNEHKLDFFLNNIKSDLVSYKEFLSTHYNKKNRRKFGKKFFDLTREIDPDLLKTIGLIDFLESIIKIIEDNNESVDISNLAMEEVFDAYHKELPRFASDAFKLFLTKFKQNEAYEPLINVVLPTSKMSMKDFLKEKYLLQIEINKLQEWVIENNKKILVTFDGRDASGKGSAIDFMTENMNPKHYRIETFGVPDKYERNHWFERYEKELPEKGEIVFFDRSWYNRAYAEPVMGYCSEKEYDKFMNEVDDFEKMVLKKGVMLVKIWMSVPKDTQKLRFELRKSNPLGYWKFSDNDQKTIDKWDEFTKYINTMLKHTGKVSRWNIIKSEDERQSKVNLVKKILAMFPYDHKESSVLSESIEDGGCYKFIFLDIDGVLIDFKNQNDIDHKVFNDPKKWSKSNVEHLNILVEQTGANVVITSSYHKHKSKEQIQDMMRKVGYKYEVYDMVERSHDDRGEMIHNYLKKSSPCNFVILDDNYYDIRDFYPEHLVKLHVQEGFTEKGLEKALKILNGKNVDEKKIEKENSQIMLRRGFGNTITGL